MDEKYKTMRESTGTEGNKKRETGNMPEKKR
jgi:hypothetical protein